MGSMDLGIRKSFRLAYQAGIDRKHWDKGDTSPSINESQK